MNDTIKARIKPLGPGLSNEQIAAAEAELEHVFPEAYRRVLRAMNGFVLLDGVFYRPRSPERKEPFMADVHIVMGAGHRFAAQDLLAWNRTGNRPPKEAFAFATDSGGNSFIVYTQGPRRDEVAFRDHEYPFNERKLADSMDEFLGCLVDAETPEVLADFPALARVYASSAASEAVKITRPAKKKPAAKKVASTNAATAKKTGAVKKKTAAKGRTATRRG